MSPPTSLRRRASHRHRLAFTIASLFAAGSMTPTAIACDFCDQGDGGIVCDSACDSCATGCDSCGGIFSRQPGGPIFKALDKFAGGIEKVFGLDKCGTSTSCDACDAAMINDLMVPMDAGTTHSSPVLPSVPAEDYAQPLEGYTQPMRTPQYVEPQYNAPRYVEPQYIEPQYIEPQYNAPEYVEPIAPQPEPLPPIQQGNPGTSKNPFSDDEVRFAPPVRSQQANSRMHTDTSQGIAQFLRAAPQPRTSVHRQQATGQQYRAAGRVNSAASLPQPVRVTTAQQVILTEAPAAKKPVSMIRRTSGYTTDTSDYFAP